MATIDSPAPEGFRREVIQYLDDGFRAFDKKRLEASRQGTLESDGNEHMDPGCRIVINIAALHTEKHLQCTLERYLAQQVSSKHGNEAVFEVFILVNGPQSFNGERLDLTKTKAHEDVLDFMSKHPQLKISLAHANYPEGSLKIGLIRKDLAALTMKRALSSEGVDLDKLILVTSDADLAELAPQYIETIDEVFDKRADVAAMVGFVDYPHEDFYSDHLFLTVQRFVDVLETMRRFKMEKLTLRGGNSMIRLPDYVRAGGHLRSRKSENLPIYRHIIREKGPSAVVFDRHRTKITTSARRQIAAINQGTPLVDRYQSFGKPGDLAEKYQVPSDELELSEVVHKVTSSNFSNLLAHELQSIYDRAIGGGSDVGDLDDGGTILGKNIKTQEFMKRAGFYLGIRIDFEDDRLRVQDISKLRALILKKYDRS
jgi:hypothetical protein